MKRNRIARKLLISAMAIMWCFACYSAEPNVQKDVEKILSEEGLTGIAWTLISEEGQTSVGAAGLRESSSRAIFSSDTRFHVGSLTKSLLATGVLKLATEGHIDLDAPALRYLPGLDFYNPWADSSVVTVRHLLDHTSGLSDAHMWHIFSQQVGPDTPLINAFPDPKVQLHVRSQPGSRFSYSNMGYTLLGMLIESVVGDRYERYLDEQLLAPLAMHDSTFEFTTQEGEDADLRLAWGHVDGGLQYAASPIFLRPAGQFTTTAADLARFAEFMMSDGVIDDQVFVEKALMRSRGRAFGTEAANQGLSAGYALGLGRRDRHGVVGYCHGGNILGFVAMLCIFPSEHKGFAFSVNTDSETADYGRLEQLFIETLKIGEPLTPRNVNPNSDMSEWHGLYVFSPNRFQMFEYLDTVFGAIKIAPDSNNLAITSMQRDTRRLRPVGDHLFSANDRQTTSHVFYRGRQDEHLISDGFQTYRKVSTIYMVAHWVSVFLGLAGLLWILIAGTVSMVRYRSEIFWRPESPAFFSSVLLFTPIPLFATQSFMVLGDLTPASGLLAVVTLLLPVGMLVTLLLASQKWRDSRMNVLNGTAAVFVLQWCAALIASGLLPFRLWA